MSLQSGFVALNIEYDNVSDEDIDNTKEIQIEEALKLYQTALKYHSEGPQAYGATIDAYNKLLNSEIFSYPEARSEHERAEQYDGPEYEDFWHDGLDAGPSQLVLPTEGTPSTLPQLVHLAYKNHGQFLMELLQHQIKDRLANLTEQQVSVTAKEVADASKIPLGCFSEALDKDEDDVDLWSRSAAVAGFAGSGRIARFCLEAVLDGDEEALKGSAPFAGLEEGLAVQQLRDLVLTIKDDLALITAPLAKPIKKKLADALRRRLMPYPL
ncbi:hypothetical protein LTS18_006814, partial [Coniosporium uncinatum]